jgi:lycopene beta-cyclase
VNGRPEDRLVIVGGGLSGCLTALALAKLRPELPLLLIEAGPRFGGNHLWSFFDPDVLDSDRWLVAPFVEKSWTSYDIRFPNRRRTIATGYSSASSRLLDSYVRERLRPDQYRLRTRVAALKPTEVELADGAVLRARGVIDARGFSFLDPGKRDALDLAWQKFVGRDVTLDHPHGLERPVVMDAIVEQVDGFRFVYSLPFDEERMLVEDTYYSDGPHLDVAAVGQRLDQYIKGQNRHGQVEREEKGVLPVALGGDFDRFWPARDPARIGVMGGFFHPTTGYSLPDAVRVAMRLAQRGEMDGVGLAKSLRAEAKALWRERGFYRLLNRMMFRAAAPEQRFRVLEHFYRLDEQVIGRFYAGRLRSWDKFRILSGRPPVPIGRAIGAMIR